MRALFPFLIGFWVVLAARVVIALARLDEFRGEELYIGSLAHALSVGMPLDTSALPVISHLRGSVVFGLLTVPVFCVTGPTMIGLKTVACLWSALTGGTFALVCARAAAKDRTASDGRVAAWVGALLFAFLPPSFQMVDVLALGSHGDVSLVVLTALALLLKGDGPLSNGRALAFGATLGFGVLFSLQFVVALPALGLAWLARDPKLWKRASTGLVALGALPFAYPIHWLSRSAELVNKPVEDHFLPEGIGGVLPKLAGVVTRGLPASWLFDENGGAWLAWPYALAIVLGLGVCVQRALRRDRLALHALAHPAVVLLAFAISDFELNLDVTANGMGSRYFMPILPFLVVGVALGAQRLRDASRLDLAIALALVALVPGVLGWGAVAGSFPDALPHAAVLACAAVASAWLWKAERHLASALAAVVALFFGSIVVSESAGNGHWAYRPATHGTSFPWFRTHLEHAGGDDSRARLAWSRRIDPDWDVVRPLLYTDIVATPPPAWTPKALAEAFRAARQSGELAPYLAVQIGRSLAGWKDEARRSAFLTSLRSTPEAAWVDRGLGSALCEEALVRFALRGTKSMAEFAPIVQLADEIGDRVLEGAGFRVGTTYSPYNDRFVELVRRLDELPARAQQPFLRGLAYGYRCRFVEATFRPPGLELGWAILKHLPADELAFCVLLAERSDAWSHP